MGAGGTWPQGPNRPFPSFPYDCPQSLGNHDAIRSTLTKDTHTVNGLDLPLTTLTGSFEVAAELMGLESLELEACVSL